MTAQPNSPNHPWHAPGYTIERDERGARTIRRPDGSVVDIPPSTDRHAAEISAAHEEYRRLPHGPAECLSAQENLPI